MFTSVMSNIDVIVRSGISIILVCVLSAAILAAREIDPTLKDIVLIIVGFYFGVHTQNRASAVANGVRKTNHAD